MLELGEGLRRAADVAEDRGAFGRAGVGAEGRTERRKVTFLLFLFSTSNILFLQVQLEVEAESRVLRPSPDRRGSGAMLSGVHHPAHVTLHGRVGAVSGLPLPRRLQGQRGRFEKAQQANRVTCGIVRNEKQT